MANIVELRELSDEELRDLIEEAQEEMFNLRFQKATGSLENTSRIRSVRREIAQFKEVLGKRDWALREAAGHSEIAPVLEGKEWNGTARYLYEEGAWQVELVDDSGSKLANATVDLNKKRRSTRRQRENKPAVEKVISYEVFS